MVTIPFKHLVGMAVAGLTMYFIFGVIIWRLIRG